MNPLLCVAFFAIGLVEDFIVGLYYTNLSQKRAFKTAGISTVHTLLAVFVVATIITGDSIPLLACYAIGGGVGTFLVVKHG
jgi:hypothetical protein